MLKRCSEILKVIIQIPAHHRLFVKLMSLHIWSLQICELRYELFGSYVGRIDFNMKTSPWEQKSCCHLIAELVCSLSVNSRQWCEGLHTAFFLHHSFFFADGFPCTSAAYSTAALIPLPNSSISLLPTDSKQPPLQLQAVCTHRNVLPNGLPTSF